MKIWQSNNVMKRSGTAFWTILIIWILFWVVGFAKAEEFSPIEQKVIKELKEAGNVDPKIEGGHIFFFNTRLPIRYDPDKRSYRLMLVMVSVSSKSYTIEYIEFIFNPVSKEYCAYNRGGCELACGTYDSDDLIHYYFTKYGK